MLATESRKLRGKGQRLPLAINKEASVFIIVDNASPPNSLPLRFSPGCRRVGRRVQRVLEDGRPAGITAPTLGCRTTAPCG